MEEKQAKNNALIEEKQVRRAKKKIDVSQHSSSTKRKGTVLRVRAVLCRTVSIAERKNNTRKSTHGTVRGEQCGYAATVFIPGLGEAEPKGGRRRFLFVGHFYRPARKIAGGRKIVETKNPTTASLSLPPCLTGNGGLWSLCLCGPFTQQSERRKKERAGLSYIPRKAGKQQKVLSRKKLNSACYVRT